MLARSEPDRALREAAVAVVDWDGGTRIGASLKELLAAQVARLSRLAHRLVWVNPLKGSPRYEPLARGMAAALPHVDAFLAGHNLASLEALCEVLGAVA